MGFPPQIVKSSHGSLGSHPQRVTVEPPSLIVSGTEPSGLYPLDALGRAARLVAVTLSPNAHFSKGIPVSLPAVVVLHAPAPCQLHSRAVLD